MPSFTPLGDKLRSFRVARGLTQIELALAAGVAERTVRNAEKSRPLSQNHLEYLSQALGVPFAELVEPSAALAVHLDWQRNLSNMMVAMESAFSERDAANINDFVHREVEFDMRGHIPGVGSIQGVVGHYKRRDGVKRFVDNVARYWEETPESRFLLEQPVGSGNVVVIRGALEMLHQEGHRVWGQWCYICEFEKSRLRRIDSYIVPGTAPPGLEYPPQDDPKS